MATDDDPICRFCFEGGEDSNPLINPCNCIGSMKYVHVKCIRRWRANTTNDEWISRCQLCLTDYVVYLRWPKEDLPRDVPFFHLLTQRHYVVTTMVYYLHLTFLSLYPIILPHLPKPKPQPADQNLPNPFTNTIQLELVQSPYNNLQYLYFTRLSYGIYLSMLGLVTLWYLMLYYKSFLKYIKNRRLYAMLWLSCITDHGMFQTPFMTIFLILSSGILASLYIIPFGYLYIYMLAYISRIHITIIRKINSNAEIF